MIHLKALVIACFSLFEHVVKVALGGAFLMWQIKNFEQRDIAKFRRGKEKIIDNVKHAFANIFVYRPQRNFVPNSTSSLVLSAFFAP